MRQRRPAARRARVVLALVLTCVGAATLVPGAAALAFADTPCIPTPGVPLQCPSAVVEAEYSIKLEAKTGGGAGPPYSYVLLSGAVPDGMTLRSDGLISGRPTTAGTSTFWLELRDRDDSCRSGSTNHCAQREFAIRVDPRVLVTTGQAAPATIGAAYEQQLVAVMKSSPTATAPPPQELAWSVVSGQLPPGLTLDAAKGLVSGVPTGEGSYSFVVRAALPDGRADTQGLSISVRQPLAVRPSASPPAIRAEVGVQMRQALSATGGAGTYAWSVSDGALPPGVALTAGGVLIGTPRAAGSFRAAIAVSDGEGRSASLALTVAVAPRLRVETAALPVARVGRPYRVGLRSSGGVSPIRWSVAQGPLPRGVRFDRGTATLTGVPQRPGRFRVTVRVTDRLGVVATRTYLLIVAAPTTR